MIDKKKSQGTIAVLKPFRLNSRHIERLNSVNSEIIENYTEHLSNDFKDMKNLNLDTGYAPLSGKSRHGDMLIKRLKEENIENRFLEEFKGQSSYLKSWNDFKDVFYSKQI